MNTLTWTTAYTRFERAINAPWSPTHPHIPATT